jgi:hypothetical protein
MYRFLLSLILFCYNAEAEDCLVEPSVSQKSDEEISSFFHPQSIGNTLIKKAWVRATKGKNAAVFMTLENPEGDRLIKAVSTIANTTEIHQHIHEGNIMRMRPVESLEIKNKVVLKPGGLHIMLIDLDYPLKEGTTIPLELTFEKSGTILINVPVK